MNMFVQSRAGTARLRQARRQRGVTLVIALIFMVVLTLLGVGMVRSTTSEERMSANGRDIDIAFAAAEAALRAAEIRIQGSYSSSASTLAITAFPSTANTCATGLCVFASTNTTPIWLNTTYNTFDSSTATVLGNSTSGDVTSSPTIRVQTVTTSSTSATQPAYYIELARRPNFGSSSSKDSYFYRVTAKGYGARSNSTQVLLQEGLRVP
jgi:type IV pilus assembly protein PilX